MSDEEQLDRDIREYLEKEPNLRRDERIMYLKGLFNRHLEMTKLEHVITSNDLFHIISSAKQHYVGQKSNISLSRKQVDNSDLPQISLIESFITYLNRMNVLKKLVKFDYRE